jgi:hypothetical protein
VYSNSIVQRVSRNLQGFTVCIQRRKSGEQFVIVCQHLMLATGIFTCTIPPPPIFLLLQNIPHQNLPSIPVLVGSGFCAADAILTQPLRKKKKKKKDIIHIYVLCNFFDPLSYVFYFYFTLFFIVSWFLLFEDAWHLGSLCFISCF